VRLSAGNEHIPRNRLLQSHINSLATTGLERPQRPRVFVRCQSDYFVGGLPSHDLYASQQYWWHRHMLGRRRWGKCWQRQRHGSRLTPLQICHDCDQRQRPCAGRCRCLADPDRRDIVHLAQLNLCPLGKFPNRLLGDWLALVINKSGAKWLHSKWRKWNAPPNVKVPASCDTCGKRQAWLNRQHEKWRNRWKRRRHARVLREARRKRQMPR
jgi:hypothetical protein